MRAWPSKTTSPCSGRSCPQTQLNSVVLPAPLGPTRPTLSPANTSKVMLCTAWIPPKDLHTLRNWRSGASAIGARRGDRVCLQVLHLGLSREEQALEALRRPALLVLEDALGVLGVGEGTEGEED